ncbi:hypothetical protein [Jiangella sp. DSM 45060]|uniref:hypothetical protein n=1 Tax=Jiangella sp. DSM 45060 TaxID=1798224 RepID=UPI00087BB7BA|nr:hypothetical protein [Jiangella sp. DSM 45060]SDS92049.1 hypothetical protein SAMN04515669_2283 [Jiangella sp. DSM 45060]
MSRLRITSLRSLVSTGQQTREWMARASTPETRAEIRRWSRWETASFCLMAIGAICALALPIIGLGLAVWYMIHDDAPWLWWLFGSLGITMLLLIAGAALGSRANDRRLTALYADGQTSIGRLDEVITHPGGGDDQTTYVFLISAQLPGEVILHRRLYWGEWDGWGSPERWVGRSIRFRHNTLDPDDLQDVLFDGWPNRKGAA